MTETCCTCRFWHGPWNDGEEGQCRRFPPTAPCIEIVRDAACRHSERAVPVECHGLALTDYPIVLWDGWCGEWKGKR